jgi:hypothetical protein
MEWFFVIELETYKTQKSYQTSFSQIQVIEFQFLAQFVLSFCMKERKVGKIMPL